MYQNNKPWESEHSGYFNSKKEKSYHKDDKEGYNAGGSASSDYVRNKENKDRDEEKKENLFEEDEKKNENTKDEDISFTAARQVFNQNREEQKEHREEKKKNISSIEEAIKKAIEDEKKTIILD